MTGSIVPMGEGLYALAQPYPVDGRVSWHAPGARGWAACVSYLVVEPDEALLIDTGLSVHEGDLLDAVRRLLPPGARLSVVHTRTGDFTCVCNTAAIVREFGMHRLYGSRFGPPGELFSFRPGRERIDQQRDGYTVDGLARQDTITVGRAGTRVLDAFVPELRLINTHWLYDRATGTLFSSDSFSHVLADSPAGPWIVRNVTPALLDPVREHLMTTRYWWLDGAWSDPLRADLEAVFDAHPVRAIAPTYGAVIAGPEAVAAVVERTLAVLAEAGHPGPRPPAEVAR